MRLQSQLLLTVLFACVLNRVAAKIVELNSGALTDRFHLYLSGTTHPILAGP